MIDMTPPQPDPPFDLFLILQAAVVGVLGILGVAFIVAGQAADGMLIGTGLLGALSLHRKPPG
jgi:hypothetical protein